MPFPFTISLLFTCCFLHRWICISSNAHHYPKPSLRASPGNVIERGGSLTFYCTTEEPHEKFELYKDSNSLRTENPSGNEAEFIITDIKQKDEGKYYCYYRPESNKDGYSESSDVIVVTVRGNSTVIIASVVCSALLVIALLFSAICYNKWKRKKASSDIQKRNLPQSEEEPAAVAETMYATITCKLDPYSTIISAVGQQEGDEAKGELAYATLNKEALERKEPLPYSRKSETTLYATVNVQ